MTSSRSVSPTWHLPDQSLPHDICQISLSYMTSARSLPDISRPVSPTWHLPDQSLPHDISLSHMTSARSVSPTWHLPDQSLLHDICQTSLSHMTSARSVSPTWHLPDQSLPHDICQISLSYMTSARSVSPTCSSRLGNFVCFLLKRNTFRDRISRKHNKSQVHPSFLSSNLCRVQCLCDEHRIWQYLEYTSEGGGGVREKYVGQPILRNTMQKQMGIFSPSPLVVPFSASYPTSKVYLPPHCMPITHIFIKWMFNLSTLWTFCDCNILALLNALKPSTCLLQH